MTFLLIAAGVLATGVALYLLILLLCAAGTRVCRWLDRRTARRKADAATRVIRRLDLTEQIPVIGHGDDDAPGGAGRTPDPARTTGVPPLATLPSRLAPDSATVHRAVPATPRSEAMSGSSLGRCASAVNGPQGRWIEAALPPYLRQHP
jgi:hypothetical protein